MPAYWVARSKINDPVEYKKYTDLVPAIIAKYGGKVLARGGRFQIMEGPQKFHRFVVIEFPTFEQGVACFTPRIQQGRRIPPQRRRRGRNRDPRGVLRRRVDGLVRWIKSALLTVLLNTRRSQPGQAVLVDRILPGEEFLDGERVTAARLFQRKKSAADRGNDFCLAANDPTFRSRCRQIGDRQGRTVWPDDVLDPRAMGLGHWRHSQTRHYRTGPYAPRLKICLSTTVD